MNTQYGIVIMSMLCAVTNMHAATGFKSTLDAINAISNEYNTILQAPNIYDKNISLNGLIQLGNKLTEHVMKKQGVLNGKKSPRNVMFQGTCEIPSNIVPFQNIYLARCTNLFDFWDLYVYPQFTQLINNLMNEVKIARLTGEKHNFYTDDAIFKLLLDQVIKIRKDSILPDKQKLADIMIFFIEHNRELIDKAMNDRKKS